MVRIAQFFPPNPMSFLAAEVKTGITFSTIALRSPHRETVSRNRAHARKAYNMTLYFMTKSSLTRDDLASLQSSLAELRSNLLKLGEAL